MALQLILNKGYYTMNELKLPAATVIARKIQTLVEFTPKGQTVDCCLEVYPHHWNFLTGKLAADAAVEMHSEDSVGYIGFESLPGGRMSYAKALVYAQDLIRQAVAHRALRKTMAEMPEEE
jgi:hypothetical protein